MKRIEAYLRPDMFEPIRDALKAMDINGLSISQIMGCGQQMGWKEYVRGSEVEYNFLPKVKIEAIVPDSKVESTIEKIIQVAYTGEVGDGKIFISDVIDAIRIRTGERGDAALS
ncbi:MAG: P-II family nitrogen regulator [Eubacteriales bacterium]|nr:P-II family nitrogen regulator [Eubacteriales bacterium]